MNRPQATLQMPPQMSTIAAEVDDLYYFIYWLSVVSFVAIVGVMLFYVWKFRRQPGVKAQPAGHNTALEIFWTFTPLLVLAYLFHAGFKTYLREAIAPPDSVEIRVVASQWQWEFIHANGASEINTLTVPANRPVRLIMSSKDVLHSFYVPEFRVKRDVVPGMFSTIWFEATHETGDRPVTLFCAEYCGALSGKLATGERRDGQIIDDQNTNHSTMLATVNVIAADGYAARIREIRDAGSRPPAECEGEADPQACWGRQIHGARCVACHSVEQGGAAAAAPNWFGIWGTTRQFVDGSSAPVDENYIRQAILEPSVQVVQGFNPIMPAQNLNDAEVAAVTAYIRSLHP